jgi:hypothetical protein
MSRRILTDPSEGKLVFEVIEKRSETHQNGQMIGEDLSEENGPLSRVHPSSRTFLIEVRRPTSSLLGKYILVELERAKLVRKHLIWHGFFRGFSVLDWFILWRELETNKGLHILERAVIAGLLFESSNTRKGLVDFKSRTKPIFQRLGKVRGLKTPPPDPVRVSEILRKFSVPEQGLPLNRLRNFRDIYREYTNPKDKRFVGVGYNDHGTLGTGLNWQSQYNSLLWEPSPVQFDLEELISYFYEIFVDMPPSKVSAFVEAVKPR